MTRFLTFPARNPHASKRADEITQARLAEVWGPDFNGQEAWPDGITVRACTVTVHPDGRAAIGFDERHERHLTANERSRSKRRPEMEPDGWFPDEGVR